MFDYLNYYKVKGHIKRFFFGGWGDDFLFLSLTSIFIGSGLEIEKTYPPKKVQAWTSSEIIKKTTLISRILLYFIVNISQSYFCNLSCKDEHSH